MAWRGGQVQLEQCDMRLALSMAKMTKEGFSRAAIEERNILIQTPHSEVWEEKKRGVEFPAPKKVKAAIERHPAMLNQNQVAGWLPSQNGASKKPETLWRRKGTGAHPPDRRREQTPEPTPPLPGTPPAPTGNTSGVQPSEIVDLPAADTYSNTALPCGEF